MARLDLRSMPWRVRVPLGIGALLGLYTLLALLIGNIGGARTDGGQPYRWDGRSSLLLVVDVFHTSPATCVVTPDEGETVTLRWKRYDDDWLTNAGRIAGWTRQDLPPGLTGPARIVCDRARAFSGPAAVAIDSSEYTMVIIWLPLFVAVVIEARCRRRRRTARRT